MVCYKLGKSTICRVLSHDYGTAWTFVVLQGSNHPAIQSQGKDAVGDKSGPGVTVEWISQSSATERLSINEAAWLMLVSSSLSNPAGAFERTDVLCCRSLCASKLSSRARARCANSWACLMNPFFCHGWSVE
jgi:hypothetical protein